MNYFKRICVFALCLVLFIGILPTLVHAEYSTEILHSSGHFYYTVDDGEVVITRGAYDKSCPREGWPITMTIPDMINGYPVVRIENGAFWSWYALDTVYLPDTLEKIGNNAFKDCELLRVVDMPHVISIGNYAFQDCSSLECINIPSSAEYMGKYVFWRCKGVRELIIGEVTGKRPDHYLNWDYASVLSEIGSPETVKIGNIVREFDLGYIFRNELRELWVAKSVNMSGDSSLGIPSDTLVYGYSGSTAEVYAKEQEVTFIPLDDDGTAEEPLSMELTEVYPARGESYGRVDDLKLSFNMTPSRNVYGGSIYIKNRKTDETVLELDWEQINIISLYDGNTVSLPGVLDGLGQGDYYVLVDKGLFTAKRVNDSGILYSFPGITQKDYWTFSVKGNPILEVNGGSFTYYSSITKETERYSLDYTDEWFFGNNKDYNHDLARMSIRMAMAAARTGTSSIKDLFNTLGLSYSNDSIHYPTPGTDTIGYAIGSKTVMGEEGEKINLIAVAVRGGGYKNEWASNFIVGSGTEHEGFSEAADALIFDLKSYIRMMPDKQNLRIWITGYSRAAAVSNLAAHRLNELAAEGAIPGLGDSGVYAYCFECPRGVRSDAPGLTQPDENIFNIVNPVDVVPLLAPVKWGFGWYGTTYYLPSKEYSYQTFTERFGKMQQCYEGILIRAGAKETAEALTETMPGQQGFLRDTLDSLAEYLGGQNNYIQKYQELLFQTMDTIQGGDNDGLEPVMRTIVNILPGFFGQHPELTIALLNNLGNIGRAHYPELCLAWMDAIGEKDLTEEKHFRPIVNPFVDVKEKDYFYKPVLWAVENGITSGVSADRFTPGDSCTRAQVVTFLWRAAGEPAPASENNPFEDVSSSAYYYDAVLWAMEKGITSGTGKASFSPNAPCTRAQVVTFLWRAAGEPEMDLANNPFADVREKDFYYEAVIWAVGKGVTSGVSSTQFAPDQTCTRGQVVTFLYRV